MTPFGSIPRRNGVRLIFEPTKMDIAATNADIGIPLRAAGNGRDSNPSGGIPPTQTPISGILSESRFSQVTPAIVISDTIPMIDDRTRARPATSHVQKGKPGSPVEPAIDLDLSISVIFDRSGPATCNTSGSGDPPPEYTSGRIVIDYLAEAFDSEDWRVLGHRCGLLAKALSAMTRARDDEMP
ncbi:hypothetical protein U0C82_18590 [Fulvimarina sp. 2208YS6-2-32]|uniref:Uncharacterized protein n=1 Tax=Fulvimarina uroteuthidis TaxID=3098149 RepID=A0ABU5I6X2_9HYPH|nr:hypothetical protein [Fulvimarina sp. 2208YS6-2-32]MDY8111133.1 hypothetical protein [Fulvimarina sp. 2208YS6-2-32]